MALWSTEFNIQRELRPRDSKASQLEGGCLLLLSRDANYYSCDFEIYSNTVQQQFLRGGGLLAAI
jgi:hypothetical protein